MCVCGGFKREYMKGVGDLLAVLVFVVHDAFKSQTCKVLKHKIIVLGDAAGERDTWLVHGVADISTPGRKVKNV